MTRNEFMKAQMSGLGVSKKEAKAMWRHYKAESELIHIIIACDDRPLVALALRWSIICFDKVTVDDMIADIAGYIGALKRDIGDRKDLYQRLAFSSVVYNRLSGGNVKPNGTLVFSFSSTNDTFGTVYFESVVDNMVTAWELCHALAIVRERWEADNQQAPEGVTIH